MRRDLSAMIKFLLCNLVDQRIVATILFVNNRKQQEIYDIYARPKAWKVGGEQKD